MGGSSSSGSDTSGSSRGVSGSCSGKAIFLMV